MPNHVTTICTVTGPAASVAAFVEKHIVPILCEKHDDCKESAKLAAECTGRRHFDLSTIIPRPKVLDGTISPNRDHPQNRLAEKETGYSNWYDWAIDHWDTKWNAYDFEERERAAGRYVFKFETAWSFPEKPFRKLAELHSDLVIAVKSFDEGYNFACTGEFNGKNDYECDADLATDDFYREVYGRSPYSEEEEEAS